MKFIKICIFVSLLIFGTYEINPVPNEIWETGRLEIDQYNDKMFYYLFKSKKSENAPLIIWLDGGPGCTSASGAFLRNGPRIFNKSSVFQENEYSWSLFADLLYIDNPLGAGYSTAAHKSMMCQNETCVAQNLYSFLLHFIESHSEYINRDLYLTGESYAGHYVPSFASHIVKSKNPWINLKGIGIGNGLVDLYEQLPFYPEFLYANGNITKTSLIFFKFMTTMCSLAINFEDSFFNYACNGARNYIANFAGIKDVTDITWTGREGVDISKFIHFMNQSDVRSAFGVHDLNFLIYSGEVYWYLKDDIKLSIKNKIVFLIESNIKVIQWFGNKDYLDNWMSGYQVAKNLPWNEINIFNSKPFSEWKDSKTGEIYGEYKSHKNYKFIKVYNAGHSIFDRRRNAGLEILRNLLS